MAKAELKAQVQHALLECDLWAERHGDYLQNPRKWDRMRIYPGGWLGAKFSIDPLEDSDIRLARAGYSRVSTEPDGSGRHLYVRPNYGG